MKVLYICTHNRCRSILSEAVTNHLAKGLIIAKSAGSQPVGQVHPLSLKYLSEEGITIDNLKSQSWDEFADFDPDVVVTVCDSAAQEACPVWFGNNLKVHWGLQDPSKLEGSDEIVAAAFIETINIIKDRVSRLIEIAALDKTKWQQALIDSGASL
jgi:arsenate reductase